MTVVDNRALSTRRALDVAFARASKCKELRFAEFRDEGQATTPFGDAAASQRERLTGRLAIRNFGHVGMSSNGRRRGMTFASCRNTVFHRRSGFTARSVYPVPKMILIHRSCASRRVRAEGEKGEEREEKARYKYSFNANLISMNTGM